ncbi:streptophobe family protein [Streptomyces sp. NPDC086766]|uniref:streptophobe family protein n=1 Tax=Streptomyces sp. NPDC086766 TaxID=3365754 RepID=UPI0038120A4E
MGVGTKTGTTRRRALGVWADVLVSAIAAVSWALVGMAATAALGLHLLGADSAGSLGPMTAAVVALGAGGSVTPSGDVSAFGLEGAQAHTAIEITPLGVSLVGALLLSWFFLRSLRGAGVVIAPTELAARAGAVVALFLATLGGLARAGHDVVTIDGGALGLDRLPGGGSGKASIPGLGGLGDIGGLLPDHIGRLIDARAAVGFRVDTAPTLLGGLAWSSGTLLIALLASRRAPLPPGWDTVHRVVRPAVSALVTVLLVAVAAGLAAAGYAALGDDRPGRIAGAALLGAPNGVGIGIPLGLFVPWDGRATGELAELLPDPLDRLLTVHADRPVTLGRLAELDGRVWLLGLAAALTMLLAGVLTAVRTPWGGPQTAGTAGGGVPAAGRARGGVPHDVPSAASDTAPYGASKGVRRSVALGFAGWCALRLGVVSALAFPLLVRLTGVSVGASLSVLGFDAFGAGIELHGHLGTAFVLGAVWGAGAGAAGALLAHATGSAGRRAAPGAQRPSPATPLAPGDMRGRAPAGADATEAARLPAVPGWAPGEPGPSGAEPAPGRGEPGRGRGARGRPPAEGSPHAEAAGPAGPYTPGTPFRPPNPATNPYLRVPDESREPEDARPPGDDVSGAPTMIGPVPPPPRPPRRPPPRRPRDWPPPPPDDGPPPPPPAPPRPPGRKP